MSWTPERVETLKKLWVQGLSASQVAQALGQVTRNAVIAKIHRLGLATRERAAAPKLAPRPMAEVMTRAPRTVLVKAGPSAETKRGPYEQRVVQAAIAVVLKAEPEPVKRGELAPTATIFNLTAHACRWPIGNPSADDFGFCGRPKARGSYCDAHAKRASGRPPSGLQDRNLMRGVR